MPSFTPPPSQNPNMWQIWDYLRSDIWGYILAAITLDWGSRDIYWDLIGWDLDRMWSRMEDFSVQAVRNLDEWVETAIADALWAGQYALDWALDAWDGLGVAIKEWGYTATSWAEAKRDEVWDWVNNAYEDARKWASDAWFWVSEYGRTVWEWIRDKSGEVWDWIWQRSGEVWDWIRDKAGIVWDWINGVGQSIEDWWTANTDRIEDWFSIYFEFYQDLFDRFRNDLLDFLEDPIGFITKDLLLATIEAWLYARWFGENQG